jgi:virginiamycin A acetyltransferase
MICQKIASSVTISSEATLGEGVQICARASIAKNCAIGRHSFVNQDCVLHTGVRLGPFCSLGRHVEIGGEEHRMDTLSTHSFVYTNQNLRYPAEYRRATPPVVRRTDIGADVWLGGRAIVRRGISIGHGAVVGAGAVVTRDVMPTRSLRACRRGSSGCASMRPSSKIRSRPPDGNARWRRS